MSFWCGWRVQVDGKISHPRKVRKGIQEAFYGETIKGYGETLGYSYPFDPKEEPVTLVEFDERLPTGADWEDQARKIAEAVVVAEGRSFEELPVEVDIHFYDTGYDESFRFPEETEEDTN